MDTKVEEVELRELVPKFIFEDKLSLIIQQNISFVEKYVDVVEASLGSESEKQIAFRELGSITFSCIEAILKATLFEINRRCKNRKCHKRCRYRKYFTISDINDERTIEALLFILKTRLIGLSPQQIDDLLKLNNLRNYVHISKNIGKKNVNHSFDRQYVYSMLNYYYELLDQLNLGDFYFESRYSCLKMLDDNGFKLTEKEIQCSGKAYYLIKAFVIFDKLLKDEELTEDDKRVLILLDDKRNRDEVGIIDCIRKGLYFSKRRFKSDKEYNELKKTFLDKLFHYIRNDSFVVKILDETSKI